MNKERDAAEGAGLIMKGIQAIELCVREYELDSAMERTVTVRFDGAVIVSEQLSSGASRTMAGSIAAADLRFLTEYISGTGLFRKGRVIELESGDHLGEAAVTVRFDDGERAVVEHNAFPAMDEPLSFWVVVSLLDGLGAKCR